LWVLLGFIIKNPKPRGSFLGFNIAVKMRKHYRQGKNPCMKMQIKDMNINMIVVTKQTTQEFFSGPPQFQILKAKLYSPMT